MISAAACGSDTGGFSPVGSKHPLFGSITLSYHGINLSTQSPYDTVRLTAQTLDFDGMPIAGTPIFSTNDLSSLRVDSVTGLVVALATTSTPAVVRVSMTYGGITRADSTYVSVVDGIPPTLDTFSIQQKPGDSIVFAEDGVFPSGHQLSLSVLDAHGDSIPGLVIGFRSSDSALVWVDAYGFVHGKDQGEATVYASTYAYGVAKYDSLHVAIGPPLSVLVNVLRRTRIGASDILFFQPATMVIGVNGSVAWVNGETLPLDIEFDNPSAVLADTVFQPFSAAPPASGNIPSYTPQLDTAGHVIFNTLMRSRRFPVAGTYSYHSNLYHTQGVIVVCSRRAGVCPR